MIISAFFEHAQREARRLLYESINQIKMADVDEAAAILACLWFGLLATAGAAMFANPFRRGVDQIGREWIVFGGWCGLILFTFSRSAAAFVLKFEHTEAIRRHEFTLQMAVVRMVASAFIPPLIMCSGASERKKCWAMTILALGVLLPISIIYTVCSNREFLHDLMPDGAQVRDYMTHDETAQVSYMIVGTILGSVAEILSLGLMSTALYIDRPCAPEVYACVQDYSCECRCARWCCDGNHDCPMIHDAWLVRTHEYVRV